MVRGLLVATSVAVLAVGLVLASTSRRATHTPGEVLEAFAESGFTLAEFPTTSDSVTGWTAYAPFTETAYGTFLLAVSDGRPRFYVFVARNDDRAREFFAPLAQVGEGPGVLDRLEGNVVVSSDASITDSGPTAQERRRIDAALSELADAG